MLCEGSVGTRVEFLDSHPYDLAVGGCPADVVGSDGRSLTEPSRRDAFIRTSPERLTLSYYRSGEFFPVSSWLYLYRRLAFEEVGMFREDLKIAYDCEFHYRLLERTEIDVLHIPIVKRRLHGKNMSLTTTDARSLSLTAATIREVARINERFGIPLTDFVPWEKTLADLRMPRETQKQ
jgi:GT2 family glycosyltransferase